MLSQKQFPQIYAPGTRQNHRGEPGRFRFFLVKHWSPALEDGVYALQVRATDTRGNTGQLVVPLTAMDGTITIGLPPE
jgi:hypothetical protein